MTYPVTSMCDINQSIVVVLVMIDIRRDINVVNPDIGSLVQGNSITVLSEHLGDGNVADDDVLDSLDGEANSDELCGMIVSTWSWVRGG